MAQANKKNNLRIAEIMQQKGVTLNELAAKITRTDKDNNIRSIAAPRLVRVSTAIRR